MWPILEREPSDRAADPRATKKRGVLLGSFGLILALGVMLALKLVGTTDITYRQWAVAVLITLAVEAVLWLILHLGWDEKYLAWDRHYVFLPMLAAALLLTMYALFAYEARALMLMAWFVALLFLAGLAGFIEVVLLSTVVAWAYLTLVMLLIATGEPLSLQFEAVLTGVFLVVSIYAGVVYERLRRQRRLMHELRRELSALATTDLLTGLPNRRHFDERLHAEVMRTRRYSGHFALVLIDVDDFKNYNDALGHPAGDELLRELARLMREQLRVSDLLARYGGEEFAAIIVNCSPDEAYRAVDRLREVVAEHPFRGRELQSAGRITISAGIAACPDDAIDHEVLVKKADDALYTAKRLGRNRVEAVVVA